VWCQLPEKAGATNLKSKFNSQDVMSFTNKARKTNDPSNHGPLELVQLAVLELRKRQLLRELGVVISQFQQLQLEIQRKGIQAPWLNK
jgi:hypothetical protein